MACFKLKCPNVTAEYFVNCPKCGRSLRTRLQVRRNGWILGLMGLLLIGLMGVISYNTAPMLLNPGVYVDGSKFTGTESQGKQILTLFATVILFGVTSLLAGVLQIITCRPSRWLALVLLLLLIPMIVVGSQFSNRPIRPPLIGAITGYTANASPKARNRYLKLTLTAFED
jgi:hypothetical protein